MDEVCGIAGLWSMLCLSMYRDLYIYIYTHTEVHICWVYTGFLGLEVEYIKSLVAKKTGSA